GVGDVHRRLQADDAVRTVASADARRVVAVGAVEDHLVGGAVAGVAAGGCGEVGVDGLDVCAGEVIDGDDVGAAEGVEVDGLDAGGVHGDVGDVAEEPEPVPVCREVDVLCDV